MTLTLPGTLFEPGLSLAGAFAAYGQGLAILALGVAAAIAMRSRPAARGALLLLALVGAAVAPLLDAALPDVRVAVLPTAGEAACAEPATGTGAVCGGESERELSPLIAERAAPYTVYAAGAAPARPETLPRTSGPSAATAGGTGLHERSWTRPRRLVAFWLPAALALGTVLSFAMLGVQLRALRRLATKSRPLDADGWPEDLADAARRLAVSRDVRLVLNARLPVPMTWGFLRPVVAMPPAAIGWCRDRRRAVLLHELAHVRRGDWLALVLARAARGLCWANPLAWWATTRLVQAQELACDRLVVEHGLLPSSYASHLVQIARESRALPIAAAAVAAARSSDVEVRVMSILNPPSSSPTRRLLGVGASVALALTLVATTAALATLQPARRPTPPAAAPLPLPVLAAAPAGLPHSVVALSPVLPPSITLAGTRPLAAIAPLRPGPTPLVGVLSLARQEPAEDGGEVEDLDALAAELGAFERRLAPYEQELRRVEQSLRPFEEQLRAIELEARVHEQAMREVEREMSGAQRVVEREARAALVPHERRLKEIESTMRPIEERMREVERELEPLQRAIERQSEALEARGRDIDETVARELEALHDRMEPLHERLEALHRELEPRFEAMEEVHRAMAPVHERMEALHRELEPVHARLEAIHGELEPIHERMEAVHDQMRPVHEEMERIHERMEPIHREMEQVHRRVERAIRGELRDLLGRELGSGVSAAALDAAADRIAEIVDINVSNGWLRLRGSAPELRDEIGRALRAAGASVDDARTAAAANAILDLDVRIPTGRE